MSVCNVGIIENGSYLILPIEDKKQLPCELYESHGLFTV